MLIGIHVYIWLCFEALATQLFYDVLMKFHFTARIIITYACWTVLFDMIVNI